MPRGRPHPPETRAAAIAALAAGASLNDVAAQYGVSRATLTGWRRDGVVPTVGDVRPQKHDAASLSDLVTELVRQNLLTLIEMAKWVREHPEWLLSQSAGDIAIYEGVKVDKIVKILAAGSQERTNEPDALDVSSRPAT